MKKFLAVLCVLTILLIFPLTLLSTVAKYRLFNTTAIKQVIRSSELAENLPDLVASAMTNSANNADATFNELTFDSDASKTLIKTALPANDIYEITDKIVDTIGVWSMTSKPIEQLGLKIDLTKIKKNLAPVLGDRLNVYLETLPNCDNTNTLSSEALTNVSKPEDLAEINCLPTNVDVSALLNGQEQTIADGILQKIPDEVSVDTDLQERLAQNNISIASLNNTINQIRFVWRWLSMGIWIGWGILVLCFLLIILLRHKPGYSTFGWLSVTHLFMTLELAPLTLVLWLAPQLLLPWFSTTIDLAGITIINNILTHTMQLLSWPVTWTMVGLAGLTIIYFIFRLIMKHSHQTAMATPTQPATNPTPSAVQPPPQ